MAHRVLRAVVVASVLTASACGSDGDNDLASAGSSTASGSDDAASADSVDENAEGSGGGTDPADTDGDESALLDPDNVPENGGIGITIGEFDTEALTFDRALCYLQEQEAAAGGGTIEATAQAHGTTAAGQPVVVDFTRYSDDSDFAGDDVTVDIGEPGAADHISLSGSEPRGTVAITDGIVHATAFPIAPNDLDVTIVTFDIVC